MPHAPEVLLPKRVLIAGVSTRAAAESAARAGFGVTAIDAFLDLDQHPSVRARSLPGSFSPHAAARAARDIDCDAVVYLAGFENHPGAVTTLAAGRALWGNTPAVLRSVRDPIMVARAFRRRGHAVPAVLRLPTKGDARGAAKTGDACGADKHWLVKPLAAGGGHGVRPWHEGMRLPRRCYLQERVDGTPGAVVFVAAEGRAVPLGVSRQLIGEHAFGAAGYRYCGSILEARDTPSEEDAALVNAACALASAAAEEFGLAGVNGMDFVARGHVPYPVEVNPRWCGSMELVERVYGLSVFASHVAACATGALPEFDLRRARRHKGAVGKAVVFARRDVRVGDTRAWLEEGLQEGNAASIRDVPRPGERIRAGRPVCTVFAAGHDGMTCRDALVRRAERVYAELATWERAVRA